MKNLPIFILSAKASLVVFFIIINPFGEFPEALNPIAVCGFLWLATLLFAGSNRKAINKMTNDPQTNTVFPRRLFTLQIAHSNKIAH